MDLYPSIGRGKKVWNICGIEVQTNEHAKKSIQTFYDSITKETKEQFNHFNFIKKNQDVWEFSPSHIGLIPCLAGFQLPANGNPEEAVLMALVSPPCTWETWIEFLSPGFNPTNFKHLEN